jgi:2-polyprenyl-6-hydroxyphenyl methylase/3-demethylubiquinone-9 3-methyltransferase
MPSIESLSGYQYADGALNASHNYLLPAVTSILRAVAPAPRRLFDLGCGNGSIAAELDRLGYAITGIDASSEAIANAKRHHADLNLHQGSAYDDLAGTFGQFPLVLSLEVVEHLYSPRSFAKTVYGLLEPDGIAIISTPYHGYWKNLAMALTGKLEPHFTALWEHGHIKFFSMASLRRLLVDAGLQCDGFQRVGRIAALAKSMICIVRRPSA